MSDVCISCDRQWKKLQQSNRKNTSKFQQRLKLDLRWQLNLQAFDKAPSSSFEVSLSNHFCTIMKLHATRTHEFVMFWVQDSSCKAVPYSSWCHRVYKLNTKTFFFHSVICLFSFKCLNLGLILSKIYKWKLSFGGFFANGSLVEFSVWSLNCSKYWCWAGRCYWNDSWGLFDLL